MWPRERRRRRRRWSEKSEANTNLTHLLIRFEVSCENKSEHVCKRIDFVWTVKHTQRERECVRMGNRWNRKSAHYHLTLSTQMSKRLNSVGVFYVSSLDHSLTISFCHIRATTYSWYRQCTLMCIQLTNLTLYSSHRHLCACMFIFSFFCIHRFQDR